MKKKSLLDLTKKKLRNDFKADPFDPPKWPGTPAERKPIPRKEFSTTTPKENLLQFAENDFSGYQLRLMRPPRHENEFERKTLYLACENDTLVCTVCDSSHEISQDTIDINVLKDKGVKIELPLQPAEIEPIVPKILTIMKINAIEREKGKLEKMTNIKTRDSYLQAFIELIRDQLYKENATLKKFKLHEDRFSSEMKQEFENLDNELHALLEFTLTADPADQVRKFIADKKSHYNTTDINSVGANVISTKLKSIVDKVDDFEDKLSAKLKDNQFSPRKEHQLPNWTQRDPPAEESQKIDRDENNEGLICK